MRLFKASRSRYRRVYGLPTLAGLALALVLSAALWFSIINNSETERWLFLGMILLILVHLTESSQPFRYLDVKILPFDPPFEGEHAVIPVQITNTTELPLDTMAIRFDGSHQWQDVPAIARRTTILLQMPHEFQEAGAQTLPQITLRTSPTPKLFRYWRVLESDETTFVLPRAVDHRVASKPRARNDEDVELKGIDQILDERLMPQMDQKLFQKTGLPYRRVYESQNAGEQVTFDWSSLEKLAHGKKGEQFSYWIKSAQEEKRNSEISVRAPFMNSSHGSRTIDWRKLKTVFAKWFYAQS